jgi:hypothetical protein
MFEPAKVEKNEMPFGNSAALKFSFWFHLAEFCASFAISKRVVHSLIHISTIP